MDEENLDVVAVLAAESTVIAIVESASKKIEYHDDSRSKAMPTEESATEKLKSTSFDFRLLTESTQLSNNEYVSDSPPSMQAAPMTCIRNRLDI